LSQRFDNVIWLVGLALLIKQWGRRTLYLFNRFIGCKRAQEFALVFDTRILTFLTELAGIFVVCATHAQPASFEIRGIFVIPV
jgi:hypothetical protein